MKTKRQLIQKKTIIKRQCARVPLNSSALRHAVNCPEEHVQRFPPLHIYDDDQRRVFLLRRMRIIPAGTDKQKNEETKKHVLKQAADSEKQARGGRTTKDTQKRAVLF